MEPNGHNERYLKTKREKLNHVFENILGEVASVENSGAPNVISGRPLGLRAGPSLSSPPASTTSS